MRVSDDILTVLGQSTCDGRHLMLPGQLDRRLYTKVAAAIEAAGGRWDRRAQAHVFDAEASDAVDTILLTGTVTREKQELGQFDSPPLVVARVMQRAGIEPGMTVLEPSAGVGNLAVAAMAAGGLVTTVEIDARRCAELTMRVAKALSPTASSVTGILDDFLALPTDGDPESKFDRVVMNPPFARQADIDHVLRATSFLKPGGRLVSVMSASVCFRANGKTARFRDFVEDFGGWFDELPENAFAASGTSVRAVLLTLPGMPQ